MEKRVTQVVASAISIVVACGVLSPRNAYAQEAWQLSWEKFVEAQNQCWSPNCDRKQFIGKTVTWEGRFDSQDEKGVRLDMSGPPFRDKNGRAMDFLSFQGMPASGETAKWREVAKGQRVRFRMKIGGFLGSFVQFMPLGDKALAIFDVEELELIEILSEDRK